MKLGIRFPSMLRKVIAIAVASSFLATCSQGRRDSTTRSADNEPSGESLEPRVFSAWHDQYAMPFFYVYAYEDENGLFDYCGYAESLAEKTAPLGVGGRALRLDHIARGVLRQLASRVSEAISVDPSSAELRALAKWVLAADAQLGAGAVPSEAMPRSQFDNSFHAINQLSFLLEDLFLELADPQGHEPLFVGRALAGTAHGMRIDASYEASMDLVDALKRASALAAKDGASRACPALDDVPEAQNTLVVSADDYRALSRKLAAEAVPLAAEGLQLTGDVQKGGSGSPFRTPRNSRGSGKGPKRIGGGGSSGSGSSSSGGGGGSSSGGGSTSEPKSRNGYGPKGKPGKDRNIPDAEPNPKRRPGGSGKKQVDKVDHKKEKDARDAARKESEGDKPPIKHKPHVDENGKPYIGPHYHPVDNQGRKKDRHHCW